MPLRVGLIGEGAAAGRMAERLARAGIEPSWRGADLPTVLPVVDACVIAGAAAGRLEAARALVRVGVAVLLAWPASGSPRALLRLAREADEAGVAALASLPLRHHPALAALPRAPRLVTLERTGARAPASVATLATLADLALRMGRGYAPRRLVATFVRTPSQAARGASFAARFDSGMLVQAAALADGPPALRLHAVSASASASADLLASGGLEGAEDAELAAFLDAARTRRPLRPGLSAAAAALRLAAHVHRRAR